ncbi:Zinc carboxypeptidase A 1 [Gryllus bimaculatus]|nr:Zinc carboxypeptidase A 1 [Gryllus bimaculatus]
MSLSCACACAEAGASADACSLTLRGAEEFSEVEARAVAAFARSLAPRLRLYLTLHSYGPLLMFPWGYTTDLPDDADELLCKLSCSRLEAFVAPNASSGSSRDWAKGELGVKYVYTMELPRGLWVRPSQRTSCRWWRDLRGHQGAGKGCGWFPTTLEQGFRTHSLEFL